MENDILLLSMQTQIDLLKQDNLQYISLINDLYQQISNLKDDIQYKNKQIEKLNIKINEFMTKDINKINNMINLTDSKQEKTLFQKIFTWS
jgi:uncharacterized lipoprotein YehR (DUF1307 family)